VIITGPAPTQADITVGTIFTGKALALDISVITTGQITAIGITATAVIPTGVTATGITVTGVILTAVILMGVMAMEVIRAGVMAMEVIRAGVTPTAVMAMGVTPTGGNPARAIRNQRVEELSGVTILPEWHGFHLLATPLDRAEVTIPLCREVVRGIASRPLHPAGLEPASL
jgi:hypothetical protein